MPRITHVALHHTVPLTYLHHNAWRLEEVETNLARCNVHIDIRETHRDGTVISADAFITETIPLVTDEAESEPVVFRRAQEASRYATLFRDLLDDHFTAGYRATRCEIKHHAPTVIVDLDGPIRAESNTPVTVIVRRGGVTLKAGLAHVNPDTPVEGAVHLEL